MHIDILQHIASKGNIKYMHGCSMLLLLVLTIRCNRRVLQSQNAHTNHHRRSTCDNSCIHSLQDANCRRCLALLRSQQLRPRRTGRASTSRSFSITPRLNMLANLRTTIRAKLRLVDFRNSIAGRTAPPNLVVIRSILRHRRFFLRAIRLPA